MGYSDGERRSKSRYDMLWLLVVGLASLLLAYTALRVVGRFAYRRLIGRPMTRLLARLRLSP